MSFCLFLFCKCLCVFVGVFMLDDCGCLYVCFCILFCFSLFSLSCLFSCGLSWSLVCCSLFIAFNVLCMLSLARSTEMIQLITQLKLSLERLCMSERSTKHVGAIMLEPPANGEFVKKRFNKISSTELQLVWRTLLQTPTQIPRPAKTSNGMSVAPSKIRQT